MSNKLYSCTGLIHSLSGRGNELEIIVGDLHGTASPHLLKVSGPLARYISALEGTDAEERYIESTYSFDSFCELRMIEIPGNGSRPAKIIGLSKSERRYWKLAIFGPRHWIDTDEPESMSPEDFYAFREWFYGSERF